MDGDRARGKQFSVHSSGLALELERVLNDVHVQRQRDVWYACRRDPDRDITVIAEDLSRSAALWTRRSWCREYGVKRAQAEGP